MQNLEFRPRGRLGVKRHPPPYSELLVDRREVVTEGVLTDMQLRCEGLIASPLFAHQDRHNGGFLRRQGAPFVGHRIALRCLRQGAQNLAKTARIQPDLACMNGFNRSQQIRSRLELTDHSAGTPHDRLLMQAGVLGPRQNENLRGAHLSDALQTVDPTVPTEVEIQQNQVGARRAQPGEECVGITRGTRELQSRSRA